MVAQRPRQRRLAALAAAISICDINQPPNISPEGLASAGIAMARIKGSPSGGCVGSAMFTQLATEEQKVHAAWCSRARRKRRSGGVLEYWFAPDVHHPIAPLVHHSATPPLHFCVSLYRNESI